VGVDKDLRHGGGRARRATPRVLAALLAVVVGATGLGIGATPAAAVTGSVTFDGESGTLAGISASGGATVTPAAARHGNGGLALTANAASAFARWNPDVVPQNHTHASMRVWTRVLNRGPGESLDLFTIQNSRRVENFDIFVNGITGRLQWDLFREDTDWSDFVVEQGRWYLVEAQVEFAGSQYTATVRIDGVNQGTITTNQAATTIRSMWVGAEAPKTHTQHYDDLALQVGDAPLGWLATTPPTISLTSPAEGAIFGRGEAVTADFSCASADFAITSCVGTTADGGAVPTNTLGARAFTVTATDVAGNTSSVTHDYTVVDETDPAVDLRTPPNGAVYAPGATVAADYSCTDEAGGSGLPAVGGCVGPVADGAPIDTSVPGPHAFTVTATDRAGNSRAVTHTYTVADGSAPVVDLRTPPEGATYARGAAVTADYSCADEVGGSGLAVEGCVGDVADGAPVNTSVLGPRDFTVTATDSAGNETSVIHTYTVVDQTRPVVELRRPAAGAVFARGEVVEADYACSDEAGGSGLAPTGGCTGSQPSGGPIDTAVLGAHEFTATATDAAGNTRSVTHAYTVVDRTSPTIDLRSPVDGVEYARGALVLADYECFDEVGGSGLREFSSCLGPVALGSPVDTWTLGERAFTVTANDVAGNVAWATNTYTVLENQPDNLIRERSAARFAGDDVYNRTGAAQSRQAQVNGHQAARFVVQVQNDTGAVDRFKVRGGSSNRYWTVTYLDGIRNVTRAVTRGSYLVGPLQPGERHGLQVFVRPTAHAPHGARHTVGITSSAVAPGHARDTVAALVRRR
jgi:hypothetical protein